MEILSQETVSRETLSQETASREIGRGDSLLALAKERFGLDYLFPYQRLVITNILAAAHSSGEDDGEYGRQIVILPTGAGKSLCFQLPAAALSGTTLVVYPLLSLMNDQARRMSDGGFSVVQLKGGQPRDERQDALKRVRSGTLDFIITNPETLQSEAIREALKDGKILHAVIDEAHCISEWGDTFRPLYLTLGDALQDLAVPIVTAFTATAGDHVLQRIREVLFEDEHARIIRGNPDRENISYTVVGCLSRTHALRAIFRNADMGSPTSIPTQPEQSEPSAPSDRSDGSTRSDESDPDEPRKPMARFRRSARSDGSTRSSEPDPSEHPGQPNQQSRTNEHAHAATLPVWHPGDPLPLPAIVFCATRNATRYYASIIERELGPGRAFFYHAGLEREEKKAIEDRFFHATDAVLCATCAYGMGVDKKEVRAVIHTYLPATVEAFLQESGRAGRDRNPAFSIVLTDIREEHRFLTAGDTTPAGNVTEVQTMAFSDECRRLPLLRAMGTDPDACAGCDRCEEAADRYASSRRSQSPRSPRTPAAVASHSPATTPSHSPATRLIREAVRRAPRMYTATEWSDLLRGIVTWKSRARGIPGRYGFGTLHHWNHAELSEALTTLVETGILRRSRTGRLR